MQPTLFTAPEENVYKSFYEALSIFRPKEELTVSEWSNKYRKLPSTASSKPGNWRTERFPFLEEIMDSLGQDSNYEETVFMKPSQIGGTESLINCIFYYIHQKPQSILSVQPTISIAERYSKQRIGPSILDSPTIGDCIIQRNSQGGGGSTILEKQYKGGMLILAGANSAAGLRSMPIGILMLDEIDGYPQDVEREGDPVALALRRTTNFPKRRIFYNSTPTEEDTSRIEPLYKLSTRKKYTMICPECGGNHVFSWANMSWDKDEHGKATLPINAYQICVHCAGVIEEKNKTWMMSKEGGAQWIAENPTSHINGFHLTALYSPLGFYSWDNAVDDWYRAQGDRDKLKTFVNTVLGETWADSSNAIESDDIMSRREEYEAQVPHGALVMTCAVDCQPDRFEVHVQAWGNEYTKWDIDYRRMYGDTTKQGGVWNELDAYLSKGFEHASGKKMYIYCTAIDSGGAEGTTDRVYEFCLDKAHRHIFPIKGGSQGNNAPIIKAPTKNSKGGWLYVLGVDQLKGTIMHSLKIEDSSQAGYWHFPMHYKEEFFKMVTSEKKVYRFKAGAKSYKWTKIRERNEALDTSCYNRAALEIIQPDWVWYMENPVFVNLHVDVTEINKTNTVSIYGEQHAY